MASGGFLQGHGMDAVHLSQRGLSKMKDPAILDLARTEDRVLVTHDLEFGELVAAAGTALPSVITFRLRNMRPDHVNHYLLEILTQHRALLEKGAIMTVTEGQIRVRTLPLGSTEEATDRPTTR